MISARLNKVSFGIIVGVIAPFFGFLIYGLYYTWEFQQPMSYFIKTVFLGTKSYQSPIISLSLLADLAVFFFFLRKNWNKAAKGVVFALLMYVPLVIYLRFF